MHEDNPHTLAHYGVKGMKWGIRRPNGGRLFGKPKPEASIDRAVANTYQSRVVKKNTDNLSNQELQALVTRMNLEQQYSRLAGDPSVLGRGEAFTKAALGKGRTVNEVVAFTKTDTGQVIANQMKKQTKRAILKVAARQGAKAARRAATGI